MLNSRQKADAGRKGLWSFIRGLLANGWMARSRRY